MAPSGPPPASAMPIFALALRAGAVVALRDARCVVLACMALVTRLLAKAPGPSRSRGFTLASSVMDQRFDVVFETRLPRCADLRAALEVFAGRRVATLAKDPGPCAKRGNDCRTMPTALSVYARTAVSIVAPVCF